MQANGHIGTFECDRWRGWRVDSLVQCSLHWGCLASSVHGLTFSSMVPVVSSLYTKHGLDCPSLQMRAMACLSIAGFQSLSYSTCMCATFNQLQTLVEHAAVEDSCGTDAQLLVMIRCSVAPWLAKTS